MKYVLGMHKVPVERNEKRLRSLKYEKLNAQFKIFSYLIKVKYVDSGFIYSIKPPVSNEFY